MVELVAALGSSAPASRDALDLESAALEPVNTFATAAQGTKADSALQPDDIGTTTGTVAAGDDSRIVGALSATTGFAVYSGGLSRSITDRLKDVIVATDYSDGSGSAANDQSALVSAINAAKTTGKAVIVTRPFFVTSQITVDGNGVSVIGIGEAPVTGAAIGPRLTATGTMQSFINLAAHSCRVHNLTLMNQVNPQASSTFLNVVALKTGTLPGAAMAGVSVNKNFSFYRNDISKIRGYALPMIIDWLNGTCPYIDDIEGQQCALAIMFRNSALNGFVSNVNNEQGGAIYIGRDSTLSGPGSAGGPQGMEGTAFYTVKGAQTVSPAFGFKDPPIFIENSGLGLKFFDAQALEVCHSQGILVTGSVAEPISNVEFYSVYATSNVDGITANRDGVQFNGVVTNSFVHGGVVQGFTGYGVVMTGLSTTAGQFVYSCGFDKVRFFNNALGDMISINTRSCYMHNNDFGSSAGVRETSESEITGFNNHFSQVPQNISSRSNWMASTGVNAPAGIPSATNSGSLTRGRYYYDETTKAVTLKGV